MTEKEIKELITEKVLVDVKEFRGTEAKIYETCLSPEKLAAFLAKHLK